LKAAARIARLQEHLEQAKQSHRAKIDAVIAEFGGDTTRLAEALLHYRQWLRQLVDAGEMIQRGKPFIVMGPGPYCRAPSRTQRGFYLDNHSRQSIRNPGGA
jgi:hypothetical protein